jgi:hypothetical protein
VPELEAVTSVRDFVERGGNVLLVIALVTAVMWALIYERFWYFRGPHKREVARVQELWFQWADHSTWEARQFRRMLISEVRLKLERGLPLIQTIVAVSPMRFEGDAPHDGWHGRRALGHVVQHPAAALRPGRVRARGGQPADHGRLGGRWIDFSYAPSSRSSWAGSRHSPCSG